MPAFNLVEPDITSSFVSSIICACPNFNMFPLGLLLIVIVRAPFLYASSKTLHVKGVLPLAAKPITTSCEFINFFDVASSACKISSSAFSTAFKMALLPPAIMYSNLSFGQLKVGKSSTPSCTPILPEVPAPT